MPLTGIGRFLNATSRSGDADSGLIFPRTPLVVHFEASNMKGNDETSHVVSYTGACGVPE
jgi:hypothetical protein